MLKVPRYSGSDQPYNFEEIAASPEFKHLLSEKKKFLIPLTVFFLIFYFMLPVLTSYSKALNHPAIGSISWVWLFSFAQFIMTWALCIIYVKKADKFDRLVEEILENQHSKGGEKA